MEQIDVLHVHEPPYLTWLKVYHSLPLYAGPTLAEYFNTLYNSIYCTVILYVDLSSQRSIYVVAEIVSKIGHVLKIFLHGKNQQFSFLKIPKS